MFELLQEVGVLQSHVHRAWLEAIVSECQACSKNATKACCGWRVIVAPDSPLQFSATMYRGHLVRVELCATSSFERPKPGRDEEWEDAPIASSSVAVNLFVGDDDDPVERHHVDLAEVGQPGPLWHLQAGGNPTGYSKFQTTWLKIPRWPIPPLDLVLACEVVVMNFYAEAWAELRGDGRWANVVQKSEDLLLSGYRSHLQRYLALGHAGQRNGTWLDMQSETNWPARVA